jgi:hypothetical protein
MPDHLLFTLYRRVEEAADQVTLGWFSARDEPERHAPGDEHAKRYTTDQPVGAGVPLGRAVCRGGGSPFLAMCTGLEML